jgi:hypothetical protein
MKHDVAGNPITGIKWTKKTLNKIVVELSSLGIMISAPTLRRLLIKMDFSLKSNRKVIASGGKPLTQKNKADRDEQFHYISTLRDQFEKEADPIISVDTKKKELIGNFKNAGVTWGKEAIKVNDHDFRSYAQGIAIPYGIYDVTANKGTVFVGKYHDTPAFAVKAIEQWWHYEGCERYPRAKNILILADNGGSNSSRAKAWKYWLQSFCDICKLNIVVCHYPSGASKWNPIEHRLFSEISKNWAGMPLTSYEKVLKFIRTTKTTTGLSVSSYLIRNKYETGEKISNAAMDLLSIKRHEVFPKLNYTFIPRM